MERERPKATSDSTTGERDHVRLPMRKFVAPEFVLGTGALELAGRYASGLSRGKVLLVTDPGVREAGWAGKVEASLTYSGLEVATFDGVSSNPRTGEVADGVRRYRDEGCSIIVAVGGGSPMDCAKAIAVVAANGGPVLRYEGVDMVPLPGPPLICVPTTAGSSADLSPFAIINDERGRRKFAIISKLVMPDVSLLDPRTTSTLDGRLTAGTGMDALSHAFEAYVSTASSLMTDMHALEAVRHVAQHLPRAYRDRADEESREWMVVASLCAGLAFGNASLGLVHAMAHSLGGRYDSLHGEANAALLETVVEFNYPRARERYGELENALSGEESGLRGLLDKLRSFREGLGMGGGLEGLGVRRGDIPGLARNALHDPCLATNPGVPTQEDIERLYERAL